MKELINLARGFSQQFECALIYGIANVAQLDNLFRVNAKQFVIVEADPNVFSKLEEWQSTLPETAPKVSCYHAAISHEDAPTTLLYQASQPGFSSTAKPNQIKRFRPGVSFSSVSVPAKKLSYFTDTYAIAANQHNIALVNCNGAEHQILSEPTSQLFSNIVVKTCSKALFGENTLLPAALTDTGYSQVKIKSAQPPMSVAALCKPLLVLKQASALEKARHEAEQYKQQVSDLIAQNETLTEQRDNQREHHLKNKEWAEQLKSQKQALEAQLEQSENQAKHLSENVESVNAELQAAQAREKSLQEKLEAETSKHKKLSEDNEGLSSQVATLNSENAAIRDEMQQAQEQVSRLEAKSEILHKQAEEIAIYEREVNSLQEQIQQASKLVSSLQDEAENYKAQLRESKQQYDSELSSLRSDLQKSTGINEQTSEALQLSNKLNLKLQIDLDHIRKQYSQKVNVEKELTELINELYIKLKQASEFYYNLEAKYPEIAGELND